MTSASTLNIRLPTDRDGFHSCTSLANMSVPPVVALPRMTKPKPAPLSTPPKTQARNWAVPGSTAWGSGR